MKVFKFVIFSLIFSCISAPLTGQSIIGKIIDEKSSRPLEGITLILQNADKTAQTNYEGVFKFYDLEKGTYTLIQVIEDGEIPIEKVEYTGYTLDLGSLGIEHEAEQEESESDESVFNVISIADNELEIDDDVFEAAGILSASRDPMISTMSFAWGAARFNPRGLTSEYVSTSINGVRMNELGNGRVFYGQWGGLNDVFRNIHTSYGLAASEYGIGFMAGTVDFDIRAGSQREQTRIAYANSNRSYDHRVMLTHSTGFNEKGWAFSFCGSHRWADEGHVQGTFYDTWSYFGGVEKKISNNHSIYLNVLNSVGSRGKQGAALLEISDMVDQKFYNPYWGWQNGRKRNSRVAYNNQPIIMLGNDLKLGQKASLSNAISFQSGVNKGSAIQWLDASNPAADYYRKLPSHISSEEIRNQVIAEVMENPDFFQVNWDYLYEANRDNFRSVSNANGIEGNTIEGNFARYIIEDRTYDNTELNINSKLNYQFSEYNTLDLGFMLSSYDSRAYTTINDLLGADYYLDLDRFADPVLRPGTDQKDLNNPNAVKEEGDIFGYDYTGHNQQLMLWAQEQFNLPRFDIFFGGEFSHSRMWRTGHMRNGFFPDNSFGDSEKRSFTNYKAKAGVSYKLGRQRVFTKAFIGNRAPYLSRAFMAPRLNDYYVPLLESSKEKSLELGYGFKSPSVDLRATGYYVDIDDDSEQFFFYSEEDFIVDGEPRSGAFGSFINHNVDKRHVGIELLAQVKLNSTMQIKGVAALGQHLYTDRFRQWGFGDFQLYFREDLTIYSNNFYVETSPQKAYNFEFKYDSPNYWFATVNFNLFGNRYLDFSSDRRIEAATAELEEGTEEFNNVIFQEKVDDAFTVDFFFHKSFKLKNDHFILLTMSISNILNEDFFSGGYEQLRYNKEQGPEWFDTRYYRAYGTNYFIGLTYKI